MFRLNTIIRFGLLFTMIFLIVVISGSALEPLKSAYASCMPCITFDNSQYPNSKYFFNHGMYITITFDTDQDQGPSIPVRIKSSTDQNGISVVFTKINNMSPPTYTLPTAFVNFTIIHPSNSNVPSIQVGQDLTDTISVNVDNSQFSNVIARTQIQNSNYVSTLGALPLPQPNLTLQLNSNCVMSGNDGICDSWKNPSGFNGLDVVYPLAPSVAANGGNVDYKYACNPSNPDPLNVCPQVGSPDIYVEVDYMAGHKPDMGALLNLVHSFQAHGIRLHLQLDDDMANYHQDITGPPTDGDPGPIANPPNFDYLKQVYFGTTEERSSTNTQFIADLLTAKRQVFHYVMFTHSQATGASGHAETPGNDIDVSIGNWAGGVGSPDDQAGTLMHELGHSLGLQHGGNDAVNCKPNYPSVMSYSRQFSSLFTGVVRPLDYSSEVLPSTPAATTLGKLDKSNLNEIMGITSNKYSVSQPIIYGDTSGVPHVANTGFRSDRLNSLWLSFENNLSDASGNGNDGVVSGTAPSPYPSGQVGNGFSFDGSTDITIPNQPPFNFNPSTPFSISLWYKGNGGAQQALVTKMNSDRTQGWSLIFDVDRFRFSLINSFSSNTLEVFSTSQSLSSTTWHHVVVTYDGSGRKSGAHIYVDKILSDYTAIGSDSLTTNVSISNSFPSTIGAYYGGSGKVASGTILDEVQTWNYPLSTSDINSLFNSHQPSGIMTIIPVDFKRDGKIGLTSISSPSLNYVASINDCPGTGNQLMGFDDWDNLQLNMWKSPPPSTYVSSSLFDGVKKG